MENFLNKGKVTRNKIITSALHLFATKGYEQTSMREIAIEVDIKAPSLYAYCSSKEELFGIVCDYVTNDYLNFVRDQSDEISSFSVDKKLYTLMRSLNEYVYENDLGHFINRYFLFPPDPFRGTFVQLYKQTEEEIKKIIGKAIDSEPERFISANTVIASFMCVIDGMIFQMLNFSRDEYENKLEETWKVFWRGIQK
ncbi:TetR/AcrR family transcriptional regulator [Paenibacillus amylolyticus]|uniref:TetR/AcrR family transcriptional regulator n=1 Tax=Paenibacillus amylolyticus TaxID=1451 RepID=A0A5M9X1F2_PAEAM|nr:TetR/AcrR family transcriptional regulator [Paenibacillus amylolyticus]